jgi:hypothetical protein
MKSWLQSPIKLTLLLFGVSIPITLIMQLVSYFTGTSISAAAIFLAPFVTGQIYAYNVKEIISKPLAWRVSIYFAIIQFLIAFLFGLTLEDFKLWLIIIVVLVVIVLFVSYFALRFGSKNFVKHALPKLNQQ